MPDSAPLVLVLGGTGMLGQAFCSELRSRGLPSISAARSGADRNVDIGDVSALQALLADVSPSTVVNCAALTDIGQCETDPATAWTINAQPAAVLADWSRRTSGVFVQVSTDHYYPTGGNRAHPETDPVTFVNAYARQKFAAEAFAVTAPQALVLRTSIVGFRGHGRPTLAEWALEAVRADAPMTLFTDAWTSSTDIWSFAEAALDLADRGQRGLLNLAASQVYSKAALVREIAAQLGLPLSRAQDASIGDHLAGRAASLGLDVTRAEVQLGRKLPNLSDVVAALLKHERT